MKNIVVLTGAGISKESGISTYRDADGLWNTYDPMQLATAEALKQSPKLVYDFYNYRRKKAWQAKPNKAHLYLKVLEKDYNVQIITQNVDALHEKAGSSQTLHLHGQLHYSRSIGTDKIYALEDKELSVDDTCPDGYQLRPHIVLFGEAVPAMEEAYNLTTQADLFIIIGTSLTVYPAASLVDAIQDHCKIIAIDPNIPLSVKAKCDYYIEKEATLAIDDLKSYLKKY